DRSYGRPSRKSAFGPVHATRKHKIPTGFGTRLNVSAVDTDGGRAEKTMLDRRVPITYLEHSNSGLDGELFRDSLYERLRLLPVRAAVEIENVDPWIRHAPSHVAGRK